jgi:hypothetical protein
MKHPPVQMVDQEARRLIEEYINQPTTKARILSEKKKPVVIK